MPCYDPPGAYEAMGQHFERQEKKKVEDIVKDYLDKSNLSSTVLLCSACRSLERMGYDFEENPALSLWWDNHKKEDAQRESEEGLK